MTIYVFGDPELLREVLLALATIFNLVEWSDPTSALGLGGNMLAVALIGLLAVAIAGVSTQQVRVDYLFMALVLFGIMFATKMDVNVEDIQTGDAAVVADVPVGIALVAAASSSAAASLTETVGTALQRPGSTTSLLTSNGFMNPLRQLVRLNSAGLGDLDAHLQNSLLDYYKFCVARTRVHSPGLFDMDEFLSSATPLDFMTENARIVNFTTIYYDDATPGGAATACHTASGLIRTRTNDIADGATGELEAYMQRAMGSKFYNTNFAQSDIEDAVDIVFRGLLTAQEFMASLFIRNLYNEMEALAQAEYGTNQTQYVAQVTQAFEEKGVGSATEGTTFLQYMFPLMTFFQFLFFAVAPFIALVMIASPFSAGKLLGGYLLFGVWAYSWMPVAAIINHYMEISLQNSIEFSDVVIAGTGYTAILGFDDFYNLAVTKLAIGSKALAATPIIVGAILSAGVFAVTKMAGSMSQAGNANRVDTSLLRPKLGQNSPLVAAGGRFSAPYGTVMTAGGSAGAYSTSQKDSYKQVQAGLTAAVYKASGESAVTSASKSLEAEVSRTGSILNETMREGGVNGTLANSYRAAGEQAFRRNLENRFGIDTKRDLSANQLRDLSSSVGLAALGSGFREQSSNSVMDSKAFAELQQKVKSNAASLQASIADSVAATAEKQQRDSGSIREAASRVRKAEEDYETAQSFQTRADQEARAMAQIGNTTLADVTEIAGMGIRRGRGRSELMSFLTGEYGSAFASTVGDGADRLFQDTQPIGLDGKDDDRADEMDRVASVVTHLSNEASRGNERAFHAMLNSMNYLASIGDKSMIDAMKGQLGLVSGVGGRVESGREDANAISQRIDEQNRSLDDTGRRVESAANALINEGGSSDAPGLSQGRTQAVDAAYGGYGQTTGTAGSAPTEAQFEAAESRFNNLVRDDKTEKTLAGKANEALKPPPGFNKALEEDLRALSALPYSDDAERNQQIDSMSQAAVTRLERVMMGQFTNNFGENVQEVFQRYQTEHGFTPRQAAIATYGEVGAREFGAVDSLVGGAFMIAGGAVGGKGGKSVLSMARLGGSAAGLAAYAATVGIARGQSATDAKEAEARVAELLKEDFRAAGGQNADKFERLIDEAKGGGEVFSVLDDFYQNGSLTDEMINQLEDEQRPGVWERISEGFSSGVRMRPF